MEMLPCWTSVKWDADYTYSFSGSISSLQSIQELWWQIHQLRECTVTASHPHLDTASCEFRAATNEEINSIMFCTVLGSEMEKRDRKNYTLHSILYLPPKPQHSDGYSSNRHIRRAPDSLQLSWLIHSVHYLCVCQKFSAKFATKLAGQTASSTEQL